jgi:hypothetical protein
LAREVDATQVLRDELVQAVVRKTDVPPSYASLLVDSIVGHLQERYGGDRLYIPQAGRTYPVDEMRDYLASTRDVPATCRKFGVSRATLYRLLEIPG